MTKEMISQYADMRCEAKEIRHKIRRLEKEISCLESNIDRMVIGKDTVRDKVYGGYGGIQGFVVEGFPNKEYDRKRSMLMSKRLALSHRKAALEELEEKIMGRVSDIESFISKIDDSHIRRIISLRVVEGLPWESVAAKIGGGNSGSAVKMAFSRYMQTCDQCDE